MKKKLTAPGLLAVVAVLLTACGRSQAVGQYALDTEHFADTFAGLLIQQGRVPPHAEERIRAQLKSSVWNLRLEPDHNYTCRVDMGRVHKTFKGTWQLLGNAVVLNQTHEDRRAKPDQTIGTLVDDVITLPFLERGHEHGIRLNRVANQAASPH
ncbi:MAG: hypothetical protein ACYTGW_13440 [Planctomycetota bacterium]|jgi:hypothetical protein